MVRDWILSGIDRELLGGTARLRSLASAALRGELVDDTANRIGILAETERIDGLLDALRDLTELGLGHAPLLHLQSTDIRRLCAEVVEEFAENSSESSRPSCLFEVASERRLR